MRRLCLAATTALIGLWGCSESDLPAEYRAIEVPVEQLASAESLDRGRALYLEYCALCHGERGDGRGPRQNLSSHPRDFTDPTWRRRMTPRKVFYVIREGIRGTAMPAWPVLDPDQTWDVVAYVLSVSENGAKAAGLDGRRGGRLELAGREGGGLAVTCRLPAGAE